MTGGADLPGTLRPVTKIAAGIGFAFAHFHVNGFDLLIDPFGWFMCAIGLGQLRRSPTDPFGRAGTAAVTMACVSLVALLSKGVRTSSLLENPLAHLSGFADTVGALITVWLIVDAVLRRIRRSEAHAKLTLIDVLRWLMVGLGVLGLMDGYSPVDFGAEVGVAWFAATAALVITLYSVGDRPCLVGYG
ncbi:hypothetical protein [Nonomuraea glycinis]|uniref:hypothetical protein n=1 Tax=Nonomuraea glycinis TaxID=2047744 RepID=UPI0033AA6018